MNEMQIFTYNETPIRTIEQDGELWWVLVDVCRVLEIGNPTMAAERMDGDEVSKTEVIDSMGRAQTANVINEAGLYSLILRSNKDEAKAFKRWVTHEVLPSIRRNGAYALNGAAARPLTVDDYLTAAKVIGSCRNERLPIVLESFRRIGIEFDTALLNARPQKQRDYSTMELLQEAQYRHGLSMAEVAERLGDVSRPILCLYRSGSRFPPPEKAERIRATVGQMLRERSSAQN